MEHFRLSELRVMRPGRIGLHDLNPRDSDASGKAPPGTVAPGLDEATQLALLACRAGFRRTGATREEAYYVSSLWRRQGGAWISLFSQDTPVANIPG